MPPRGWIGGWRQRDWLRPAMTPFPTAFVAVLFFAAPSYLGVTFTLHAHDLIIQITHQLFRLGFRGNRTVLARIVIPIDITIPRNDTRFQLLVVHSGLVAPVRLSQDNYAILCRLTHDH